MMAMLLEMGFKDERLNQRLLKKHGYSLLRTVNELVQIAEDRQDNAVNSQHWATGSETTDGEGWKQMCLTLMPNLQMEYVDSDT